MSFTLGEIATTGLPVGEHVVRIDDIEASVNSAKDAETLVFKASVAQTDNPKVKIGMKQIWSYTYREEWRSIVANDLVRAALPKELRLDGIAKNDAIVINQYMRGNFYVIKVVAQKGDVTRTNTSIIRPFQGGSAPANAAGGVPAAVTTPPPPVAIPPAVAAPVAPVAAVPAAVGVPAAVPPPAAVPAPVAPVAVAPPMVAPVAVAPPQPPAPAAEAALDAPIIQAVEMASRGQGAFPPLNLTQIRQLREIGMVEVAVMYEAAQAQAATPPPPAAAVGVPAPGTAFAAV